METTLDSRFFPLIFNSISHGIFTIDSKSRITSFNFAAEKITGYAQNEAIGRKCSEIFRSDICQTCPLQTSIDTGESGGDQEVVMVSKSGKRLSISISTAALHDEEGNIIGGVEMFRDLKLVKELTKQLQKSYVFEDIVSKSHRMKRVFEMLPLVAGSDSTVLVEGESGTGKELIARAIHNLGPRKKGPFVAINCAAVPDSLIESELFGYKKGAFTDAKKDKPGRFALAEGGTLLLDEIGELSTQMQAKLLRVLQEKEYEPLGATATSKANVRVIASTNRNLAKDAEEGTFSRQDLFYRLNVVQVELPPLRERKEDIPLLVQHFIDRFNTLQGRRITGCSERVNSVLMRYEFPGNIRELENAIEHAFVICIDSTIQVDDLPAHILNKVLEGKKQSAAPLPLEDAEKQALCRVLEENDFNRTQTARELGISRNTLWRKMKKYGILEGNGVDR